MSSAENDVASSDQIDPAVHPTRDAVYFRRILAARQGIAAAEQELRDAVKAARDAGDSWTGDRVRAGHDPSGGATALRRQLTDSRWGAREPSGSAPQIRKFRCSNLQVLGQR